MLSINGMLGPSSPAPQSPSRHENQPKRLSAEERHFSETTETSTMTRPQDHRGLQTLLSAVVSSEPSSPDESFRSGSHAQSPTQEVAIPFNPNWPFQDRKRKANDVEYQQASSPKRNRFTASFSPVPKKKRAPRPQYTKEQEDFIWFCRDDLAMSWRKVVELYNNYWHPFEVEPHVRSESGLQSRYYRILDFPVKVRKKKEPSRPDLGLIPSTQRRYPWMGVIKADLHEKQNAERNLRHDTTAQRDIQSTINGGEERAQYRRSDSATETIRTESDSANHNSEIPAMENPKLWSSPGPAEARSQIISHTSETDSEVEYDREWENSRPPTGSSYERYELKSVMSHEPPLNPRIPPRSTAIRLPPLRRYLPHISTINYQRSDTRDFHKSIYEKPRPNYGCKMSVTNLCV